MVRQKTSLPRVDLCGKVFGELTVLKFVGRRAYGTKGAKATQWLCRCSCGATCTVMHGNLKPTCRGCAKCSYKYRSDKRAAAVAEVPWSQTLKDAWKRLLRKGTLCKRWLSIFKFFQDMGDPLVGQKLCRKNRNANHSPTNSFWADAEEYREYMVTKALAARGKTADDAEFVSSLRGISRQRLHQIIGGK